MIRLNLLDRVIDWMLTIALGSMVAVVSVNVACRHLLQVSLSWSDEVPKILLVWITFLGAAAATRHRELFAVDVLVHTLPQRIVSALAIIERSVVVVMTIMLIYWSADVSMQVRTWVMPATGISRGLVYAACPIGAAFILIYAVSDLLGILRQRPSAVIDREMHI